MKRTSLLIYVTVLGIVAAHQGQASAQLLVPGTGKLIEYVGDDFEDEGWQFVDRHPKSSRENDGQARGPLGYSVNGRWLEGPERGQPDFMKVVPTPEGGLPGSNYALLLRTLNSGVPGRVSNDVQQDDLIVNCLPRLGTSISVSELPNCVVRLYLPPPEQWENRSGPHFGFRAGCSTTTRKTQKSGLFSTRSVASSEPYWPGMWIHFRSETSRNAEKDSAYIKVRGDRLGRDFHVLDIEQFGWWTLGMSFTADGMVHYFASPGVDRLTAADHLSSQYPYSFDAERFRTFFFNVCNRNDGATWSTPFVIDDPELYVVNSGRVESIVVRKLEQQRKRAEAQAARQKAQQRQRSDAQAARQQDQRNR